MAIIKKIKFLHRRILIACAAILIATSGYARKVTVDNALSTASKLLSYPEIINPATPLSRAETKDKAYYVFRGDDNKGFAIIGADDRLPRIIGYSDTTTFNPDNLPPQLSAMLDSLDTALARMDNTTPVHTSWLAEIQNVTEGKLLHTANWAQDAPYNNACPKIDGKPTLAGCGAVALAIVMKYHNWPENGVGKHSYYSNGVEIGFDFANAGFDFTKIPDDISQASAEEIEAVSKLIYAAGISLGTIYGVEGSTHSAGEEALSLSYFFNYAPDCQFIFKDIHPDSEWIPMTTKQIDEGLPVIFSGAPIGIPMGHAWVVDGYNNDRTLFHCNFGWGGESNGYYALNDLFGFYHCDGMTFNVKPNKENTPNPGSQIMRDPNSFSNPGIKVSVPEIKTGEPFEFSVEGWRTLALEDDIYKRVALVDDAGNLKEVLYETEEHWVKNLAMPSPIFSGEFNIANIVSTTPDLLPSDKIQLFIKRGEAGEWMPVTSTLDGKSYCSISGHDCATNKMTYHIADGVKARLSQKSPQGNEFEIKDGEEIITLNKSATLNISAINPNPEYRIRFSINGQHRYNINYMYSDWYILGYYNQANNINLVFSNKKLNDYDVKIDYIKIAPPIAIKLNEAGTLHTIISKEEAETITNLTLTGNINATDIWYISDYFPILEYLDLSKANIKQCQITEFPAYIAPMNPSTIQKENTLPEFGLVDIWALQEIKLPESLEVIGGWALSYCNQLKRLELPEKIKEIEHFGNDKNMLWLDDHLQKVISHNPIPPVVGEGMSIFHSGTDQTLINGTLFVPAQSVELYKTANGWKSFHNIYPLDTCFIKLDKTNIDLSELTSEIISAKVIYQGNDPELTWTISNPEVGSIQEIENDLISVIGHKNGTTTITASAVIEGKTITAECVVTVTGIEPQRSIGIENHPEPIEAGKTRQMNAWIIEDEVAKPLNENILWSSSDEKIASIDNTGMLKAVDAGQATIRATAAFNPELYIESIVTVIETSGIDGIKDDIDSIRVEGNEIIVPANCTIFDISGRKVNGKSLKPGIYIVKTPTKSIKVIVR
ncbi:MAG: C10 family peptidase [Paramuribaculum sp.]|nr:C10 family peptidase [Paramuribaculum sp.]